MSGVPLGRWARLEEFPDYMVSRDGIVKRVSTQKDLVERNGVVSLISDGKTHSRSVSKLIREAFRKPPVAVRPRPPDPDRPVWKRVKEFPDYRISNLGEVQSIRTGHILTPQGPTQASVKLMKDGKQYMKGIRKLVKATFPELSGW